MVFKTVLYAIVRMLTEVKKEYFWKRGPKNYLLKDILQIRQYEMKGYQDL